jgi:hypothetical protein
MMSAGLLGVAALCAAEPATLTRAPFAACAAHAPSDVARAWPAQYCPAGWATVCVTPYGVCYLGTPLCRGAACYCPSPYGPVWGYAD